MAQLQGGMASGSSSVRAPLNQKPRNFGKIGFTAQARSAVPKAFSKPARPSVPRAPSVGVPSSVGRSSSGRIRPSGGGGGASAGVVGPPRPPDPNAWLKSDSSYITQQSALARALKDYIAQMNSQKQQYQGQYDLNLSELGTQRESGFEDLENDYASRGLLKSGVYGQAYSDLERDFNARQSSLDTARSNFLANLATGQKNFQTEQQLTAEKARQEALARRAAKYNL